MAKWYGKIAYAVTEEVEPGIWESNNVERDYYGDIITDRRRRQSVSSINDDISLSNTISILADPFAIQNCSKIVYVEAMGNKWKVSDIEVQYPRLILSIGGLYNGI